MLPRIASYMVFPHVPQECLLGDNVTMQVNLNISRKVKKQFI